MTAGDDRFRLGFLALARTTFDMALARETIHRARRHLTAAGMVLAGSADAITSAEAADGAARALAGEDLDAVVVLQATFADSRMVRGLAEATDAPLLLWAIPEQPSGGRLRLNSFCGVNLATHALRRLSERLGLDGFAVRCWPEFFTVMGCAACAALSLLGDRMIPAGCESDVNGVITQWILQAIAGAPAFDTDMVAVDDAAGAVVLWHCGKAPLSLADPRETPRAIVHSNRQLPLLWEFPLKPGPVTLARLSAATGEYRLVIAGGEMIRANISFSGTSGRCRFAKPAREFLERILAGGLEHHMALVYGDHLSTLKVLARQLELLVLKL